MKKERRAVWIEGIGWVAAVLCLGAFLAVKADAWWFNTQQERVLEKARRESAARPEEATSSSAAEVEDSKPAPRRIGDLIGRIEIPRVGVSAVVVEGTTSRVLRKAVGHVRGTAFPGEGGNVALAAHRDSFFRGLKGIRTGDRIELETPHGDFGYRVDSTEIVDPSDVGVLAPGPHAELTLLTCFPFHWVGHAPHRLVVKASPVAATELAGAAAASAAATGSAASAASYRSTQ